MQSPDARRPLPRVLLIDDDAISREVVAMMLEIHSFAVETVDSGEAALVHLEAQDLDRAEVILMDAQMPGLSGVNLVQALRARSAARIFAISGSDPGEAILSAVDGFLLKPVEMEEVVALLQPENLDPLDQDVQPGSGQTLAPQSTGPDVASCIDPSVLAKLQGMMPAKAVREIYVAVAADLHTRLATLEAAMTAGDEPEVRRIAHAVKGGCSMVGLNGATEAAARLERSGMTSNGPVTYAAELKQLHTALDALNVILLDDFPLTAGVFLRK